MAELYSSGGLPPAQQAEQLYQKGLELKKAGDLDAALTEFRRAALFDAAHFQAQMEIGHLCKLRAISEPIFYRHTFEAFRQAARLDLNNQEAHNEYIMAAQKLNRLDEVLLEYEKWIKFNPDNENISRCRKNILTISMALMPEKVSLADTSVKSRRVVIFVVAGLFLFGLGLFGAISFFKMRAARASQSPSGGSQQIPGSFSENLQSSTDFPRPTP